MLEEPPQGTDEAQIKWESILPHNTVDWPLLEKIQLIWSLFIFLKLPLLDVLRGFFTATDPAVVTYVQVFTRRRPTGQKIGFPALELWELWMNYPSTTFQDNLFEYIVKPGALARSRKELERAMNEPWLKLKRTQLTLEDIRDRLDFKQLGVRLERLLPFTVHWLRHLLETWNRYRKEKFRRESTSKARADEDEMSDGSSDEEANEDDGDDKEDVYDRTSLVCGSIDVIRHIMLTIILSSILYACNRATNYLSLSMGLFLVIEGASDRTVACLNRMGMCVSKRSVERMRKRLSADAIASARRVIRSNRRWMWIFDNINIYVCKSQQRLTNQNNMINATNGAVIALPSWVPNLAFDLGSFHRMRGGRKEFDYTLLRLSSADANFFSTGFKAVIAHLLFRYCPGRKKWANRTVLQQQIAEAMPSVRPIPAEKSQGYPIGAMDVDEGSKKGVIGVMTEFQRQSGLSEQELSASVVIVGGDQLTIKNLRSARNERSRDVSVFHRLSYICELAQLFHYDLNSKTTIFRTHTGTSNINPASLSRHKDVLKRRFDIKKPNYADAKSLIHHSLIARIILGLMAVMNFKNIQEVEEWTPSYEDLVSASASIYESFLDPDVPKKAMQKTSTGEGDHVFAQNCWFMRDGLLTWMFEEAVRNGDPGIIWHIVKMWMYSFRGAGQTNYMRECAELIVRFETELPEDLKTALEASWFFNATGRPHHFIACDLYVEHLNYWIKVFFVPEGSGLTIQNIIDRGSSCVDALRAISVEVAKFCGVRKVRRKKKEMEAELDIRTLVEMMNKERVHERQQSRVAWQPSKGEGPLVSQAIDVVAVGMAGWNAAARDFVSETAWDAGGGYRVDDEDELEERDPDSVDAETDAPAEDPEAEVEVNTEEDFEEVESAWD
ncbi:hypothetical protein SISNIDRAFT_406895 [Sistotremastrum niveocremeum HHB9708]|uniref:DUF6589 domain-containing protein n=1 Tax=Sistotremastrum niveocremeum HHB9708 TaxID=1314777 RepID=A0A164YG49_9AGAM|nr:hypothetical protein SISNIDRAFT_406895 [Sistotremastrum niveocremeum HHB9708]